MAKKTLVEFVNTLHTTKDWQKKFENRKQKKDDWEKLVEDELDPSDAQLVLDADASVAEVEKKLGTATSRRIVWGTASIVWS
jgi:hypothetical protein